MAFVFFIITVIILYLINISIKPKKYPPGPKWLPIVGCTPEFKNLSKKFKGQHLAAAHLAKEYNTNVLGLKLGNQNTCIVFTDDLVRKVLTSEHYEGRPDSFFMRLRCMGMRKGITGVDGPLWQEHRQFTMKHLRNVGFGKPIMEEYIVEELHQLLKTFEELKNETIVDIGFKIAPHVINVLWMFIAGKRIDKEDSRLSLLLNLLRERTKAFDVFGGLLNQFPAIRYIRPEWSGYNLIQRLNGQFRDFFLDTINEHRKTVSIEDEDLIHTYLCEMNERLKTEPDTTFTDDQLVMICVDLFIAGSQTTANTLDFLFLFMITHPEVQKKVQQELDEVLMNKAPCLEDKNILPYTMSVLHETMRFINIVTLTGPRRTLCDTTLDGHMIPKNSVVLISLYSVHMDKAIWGDPEKFRPERFIQPQDGKLNEKLVDRIMPFGLGRRRCLGETLAKGAVFLFFTGVMQRFTLVPCDGIMPEIELNAGITISPPRYNATILPRHYNNVVTK